jgi:hypothetical protein
MIKILKVKNISPQKALDKIQNAGIFNYMINWGCDIDEKNKQLTFNLRHGSGEGGSFDKELKETIRSLEVFLKSIDMPQK